MPPHTLLRYPSPEFDCFKLWIGHFEALSLANNWDDAQQRAVLLTCLTKSAQISYKDNQHQQTSWTSMHSTIESAAFPNYRSTRIAYKNLQQSEGERLEEFSRRTLTLTWQGGKMQTRKPSLTDY